jgi:hypothetical protein
MRLASFFKATPAVRRGDVPLIRQRLLDAYTPDNTRKIHTQFSSKALQGIMRDFLRGDWNLMVNVLFQFHNQYEKAFSEKIWEDAARHRAILREAYHSGCHATSTWPRYLRLHFRDDVGRFSQFVLGKQARDQEWLQAFCSWIRPRLLDAQAVQARMKSRGDQGEDYVGAILKQCGVVAQTEQSLRNSGMSLTPDFHVPGGFLFEGTRWYWVEVKYRFICPGITLQYDVGVATEKWPKYAQAYGPGLVVWLKAGFSDTLPEQPGVRHVACRMRVDAPACIALTCAKLSKSQGAKLVRRCPFRTRAFRDVKCT